MSEDEIQQLMTAILEEVALNLLAVGMDNWEEKSFEACRSGELLHLRVRNSDGEVALKVVGRDVDELGEQLVLACLHNINAEQLGALHARPLNRGLQVQKPRS
ncbi:hypothetical protein [Geomonas sp.]|uniref:hypothetical protein n=1 Tax=Geomonas sp. TaxID=2651584 RepID=UPI002B49AC83|nr:hypothetical protein [Geomonas sp.]HJV34287.1 hypothetical protein [Geomonas sp.]